MEYTDVTYQGLDIFLMKTWCEALIQISEPHVFQLGRC